MIYYIGYETSCPKTSWLKTTFIRWVRNWSWAWNDHLACLSSLTGLQAVPAQLGLAGLAECHAGSSPLLITLRPVWVVLVATEQVSRRKLKCARTPDSQAGNWHHMASTPSHGPKQIIRPARFKGKERRLYFFMTGRWSHGAKDMGTTWSPGLWPLVGSITDRVLLLQYGCSFGIGAMLLFISLSLLSRWKGLGKSVWSYNKMCLNCPSLGSQPNCSSA